MRETARPKYRLHSTHATRVSPRTPLHFIKVGKQTGPYKSSMMPVYYLTTLDTDSDATTSFASDNGKLLLPLLDFIPSSSGALVNVTGEDFEKTSENR